MTKAEAIRILEQSCPKRPQKLWSIKRKEAVKMAIEALQRGLENVNADSCSEKPNRSDLISRQAAIDAVLKCYDNDEMFEVYERELKELPSAEPEIVRCKDCKYKDDGIDEDGILFLKCLHGRSYGGTRINDFCSRGERREVTE